MFGVLFLAAAAACTPAPNLSDALTIADPFTGYYDEGVVQQGSEQGWSHLVPSVTFRLRNNGQQPIANVQLLVAFWRAGDDGPTDDRDVLGLGSDPVPPGGTSAEITVRSSVGFNIEGARSELFTRSRFVDFTAKIFGKQGGRIYRLGEVKIDRQIIPRASSSRP
jgi:hypothetical protein